MAISPKQSRYDAIVVGSGPNGLAAAIRIAQAGRSVLVLEKSDSPGGGTRTEELTEPGFFHDVCSAVHPMGLASPFLSSLNLERFGLEWIHPEIPLVQTLADGGSVALHRSVEQTAEGLGDDADARRYRAIFGTTLRDSPKLFSDLLAPPIGIPRHPFAVARFGMKAMLPATLFCERAFQSEPARALLAGNAAHSIQPLNRPFTNAVGLMLQTAAHSHGWPIARGGSGAIWKAMVALLESLGGKVCTNQVVDNIQKDDLPEASAYLFDTAPSAMVRITGDRLPPGYKRRLLGYRHGPGSFKIDLSLDGPIPWTSDECRRAGTLQIASSYNEIVRSESGLNRPSTDRPNETPEKPFVLLSQPTVFDPSRAPKGKHIAWAYCHVPNGWDGNEAAATDAIIDQIERHAPGFRGLIRQVSTMSCSDLERYNPNYIGGDISCGANSLTQILARPLLSTNPYATPAEDIFLCSAATPPGAGVHGMCGYHAAGKALKRIAQAS